MYTEQDVQDVIFAQRVNNWIGNAKAGNLGEQARQSPTPEAAIRDEAAEAGEPLNSARLRQELARYERGRQLAARFVLIESGPQVEASDRAEAVFRERQRVEGPVVWLNAGYVAASPRYVAAGLRPR